MDKQTNKQKKTKKPHLIISLMLWQSKSARVLQSYYHPQTYPVKDVFGICMTIEFALPCG